MNFKKGIGDGEMFWIEMDLIKLDKSFVCLACGDIDKLVSDEKTKRMSND